MPTTIRNVAQPTGGQRDRTYTCQACGRTEPWAPNWYFIASTTTPGGPSLVYRCHRVECDPGQLSPAPDSLILEPGTG